MKSLNISFSNKFFISLKKVYFCLRGAKPKVPFFSIVLLEIIGKIINMASMFIPIKMLFVLSGMKTFHFADVVQKNLGRDLYVIIMIMSVVTIYALNVFSQIYKSRVLNDSLKLIDSKSFESLGVESSRLAKNIYVSFIYTCSDLFTLLVALIIISLISFEISLLYSIFLVVYLFFLPRFLSFDNEREGKFLKLKPKQKFRIFNGVFFLPLFIALVYLTLNGIVEITPAIFILLILRMSSSCFGSYYSNQIPIRNAL